MIVIKFKYIKILQFKIFTLYLRMTKQETIDRLKGKHVLSMKDLRQFVDDNPHIEDSTPVLIERVEDRYFNVADLPNGDKANGWNVYKHKGFQYRQAVKFNKDINNDKKLLASGNPDKIDQLEYPQEFVETAEIFSKEMLDDMKEQFYSSHCIVDYDGLVLIYSHY